MGANPETVSIIKKAQELGIYVICTDNNPDAYAKKFADQTENINMGSDKIYSEKKIIHSQEIRFI